MRLIDAEKLKEKIRSQDWKDNTMLQLALSWVYMLIDEEPAININSEKAERAIEYFGFGE
jgi:hypothetical protein